MKKTLPLILTSLSLLLASCGGGGGSTTPTPTTTANNGTTTTPSTGTGTTTTPSTGTPSTGTGTTPTTPSTGTETTPSTGTATTPTTPSTGTDTGTTPKGDFSFALTPSTLNIAQGNNAVTTASVTPANGFTGTVTYSVAGLPGGVTSSVNGPSITLTNTSGIAGNYTATVTATSGTVSHTAPLSLTLTTPAPVPVANSATVTNPAGVQVQDPKNANQLMVTYSVVGNNLYNLDTYMQFMPYETNGTRVLSSKKLANGQTELDLTLYFESSTSTAPLPFNLVVTYKDKTTQLLPVTIKYANPNDNSIYTLSSEAQRSPTAQEQAALNRLNAIRTSGVCNGTNYGAQPALSTNPLLNVANQDYVTQNAAQVTGKTPNPPAMRLASLLAGYTDPSYLFDYIQLGVGYNTPTFPDNRPYTDGAAFIDSLASTGQCTNLMRPFPNSVAAVSFGQSGIQIANRVGGLWSLVVESTVR